MIMKQIYHSQYAFALFLCSFLFLLVACSSGVNESKRLIQSESEVATEDESTPTPVGNQKMDDSKSDSENNNAESAGNSSVSESILRPKPENVEEAAVSLLSTAFSYDGSETEPTVTQENGLSSLRYVKDQDDPSDFFVVDFLNGSDYPMTLYHFCHSGEEHQARIEEDSDFQFNEEMVSEARQFVKTVYGVDCQDVTATAYGYSNKISVQLDVAENVIFQVRFYYQEVTPVGVLFFSNAEYAKEAMEVNDAVLLYP